MQKRGRRDSRWTSKSYYFNLPHTVGQSSC